MTLISTRSSIGIKYKDGTIKDIYCHYDGYLEYNGQMLYYYYRNIEKIQELIDLGDISSLNKKLNPDPNFKHGFEYEDRQEDIVVAYGRDRGESNISCKSYNNIEDYKKNLLESWKEYSYLYDEDKEKWIVSVIPYRDINSFDYKDLKQELRDKGLFDVKEETKSKVADNLIKISKDHNYYEYIDNYESYDDAFYDIYKMLDSDKIYGIKANLNENSESTDDKELKNIICDLDFLIKIRDNEYERTS